jgi:hypothetical protein
MSTVTPLPTPVPSTASPSNFDERADAFLGALPTLVTEINIVANEINTNADIATTQAANALAEAINAANSADDAAQSAAEASFSAATALNAPGTQATSSSSLSLSLGTKSLVLNQTGKLFAAGQWVSITDLTNPASNWMVCVITSFSGVNMTVVAIQSSGTSTLSNWAVIPASPYNIPTPVGSTIFLATNFGIF